MSIQFGRFLKKPKFKKKNYLSAGHIDTPFLGPNRSAAPSDFMEAYKNDLNTRTPLDRAATPREVSSVVEFLCSDAARLVKKYLKPLIYLFLAT